MSLALHDVNSIARELARAYPAVEIIAVTPGEGGIQSAELLIAAATAGTCSGLVSIHVRRDGTIDELRSAIADGMRRHFGQEQPEGVSVA